VGILLLYQTSSITRYIVIQTAFVAGTMWPNLGPKSRFICWAVWHSFIITNMNKFEIFRRSLTCKSATWFEGHRGFIFRLNTANATKCLNIFIIVLTLFIGGNDDDDDDDNDTTITFTVLSSWQAIARVHPANFHCECESAAKDCHCLHRPSHIIIITQPERRYSCYSPTEDGKLSRGMPKAVVYDISQCLSWSTQLPAMELEPGSSHTAVSVLPLVHYGLQNSKEKQNRNFGKPSPKRNRYSRFL